MGADGELTGQVAIAEDFDLIETSIGEARGAKSGVVHSGPIVESVQGFKIDGDIASRVAGIVEAAFRNTADEGHLAAFETNADGAAGSSGLAFAAASAGFAVTAGFALTKAFATMFGAGARF